MIDSCICVQNAIDHIVAYLTPGHNFKRGEDMISKEGDGLLVSWIAGRFLVGLGLFVV